MSRYQSLFMILICLSGFNKVVLSKDNTVVIDDELPQLEDSIKTSNNDSIVNETLLEDIIITAKKPIVTSDGATLTYNVTEDPEAKASSTLHILRKVPGVTVDAEENVKVNGQSSFKILINGKEDPMLAGDIKSVLKSMPASSIQKIEVISEPGAKYEAEGTGGILNIITLSRKALDGYLVNMSLAFSHRNIGANIYGRTKIKNVTIGGSIYNNYTYNDKANSTTSYTENENYESYLNRLQISDRNSYYKNKYIGGNVNMSWEPDTLNLYTLSFNGGCWNGGNYPYETMRMLDADGNITFSLDRRYDAEYSGISLSTQASYQHTFYREKHNLILTYSYNYGTNNSNSYVETFNVFNYPAIDYTWSHNMNDRLTSSHIVQLDYSNPITQSHLLETGVKVNLRNAIANSAPFYGDSKETLVIDENQHVKFNQFNNVLGVYASYTGYFNKLVVKGGIRYEYTERGIKYKIVPSGYTDFRNKLNDWIPNASLTFKFGDSQNLRGGYQMRIQRPGLYALNPYHNTMTPGQVSYGNPDLKSERAHNLSLTYSNYEKKLTGSFKINYYFTNNGITDIIFAKDNIMHQTYANTGKSNNIAFEINLNYNPINNLDLSLWMSESWTHINAESELLKSSAVGWNTILNTSVDYTTPIKLRISGYGGYGSPWIDLQSKGSSWYYYGIGLSRGFLKDEALMFSLAAQNFINPKKTTTWTQNGDAIRMFNRATYSQWYLNFSVSWRFGGLKSDVKKTNAHIEELQTSTTGNKK